MGIVPDRRHRRIDALIVRPRAAVAQGGVRADAAVGDRGGMTVIVDVDARPGVGEPGAHAARVAEIAVIAADALVDDQHDVARGLQLSRDQAHVLALSPLACDPFLYLEAGITKR